MATRLKKISVTVTPGRNEPVDNEVRLEDLLREMCVSPPHPARGRAAAAPNPTQALVLELESRLRAARAAVDKAKPRRR
jgi:hypothetical protein